MRKEANIQKQKLKLLRVLGYAVVSINISMIVFIGSLSRGRMLLSLTLVICIAWLCGSLLTNLVQRSKLKTRIARGCLPLLAFFGTLYYVKIGDENAQRLVSAIEEFRTLTDKYPTSLQLLVPRFLHELPANLCERGLNSSVGCTFDYNFNDTSPTLTYHDEPPFGRKVYHFDGTGWRSLG